MCYWSGERPCLRRKIGHQWCSCENCIQEYATNNWTETYDRIQKKELMKITAGKKVHRKDKAECEEGQEALEEIATQGNPWSTCHQDCVVKETDGLQAEDKQQSKEGLDPRFPKVRMRIRLG